MNSSRAYPLLTLYRLYDVQEPSMSNLRGALRLSDDEDLIQELLSYVFASPQAAGPLRNAYRSGAWFPERGSPLPSVLFLEAGRPVLSLYCDVDRRYDHAAEVEQILASAGLAKGHRASQRQGAFPRSQYTVQVFFGDQKIERRSFCVVLLNNLVRLAVGLPAMMIYNVYRTDFTWIGLAMSVLVWLALVVLVSAMDWRRGRYALEIR